MSFKIYEPDLEIFIKDTNLIPKKIKHIRDIRRYGKYISLQQSTEGFKIEDIIEVDEDIYYQIKFLLSGRQAVVPYEDNFTYYELIPDRNEIKSLPTIINTNVPYYGSEIKYWFYKNDIDLLSDKFYNFKSLLVDSKHIISDNKLYYLLATYLPLKDKFVDCRAILYIK